ncbi:hypothetical protein BX666DRAFT_2023622 [Dichotomocladium elegans]|nr:hypothetical protein BX666DRAFT_2023622 [Dichotomocladium elegans]
MIASEPVLSSATTLATEEFDHLPSTCARCDQPIGNRLIRALDAAFHPECFTCWDCGDAVVSKFYPLKTDDNRSIALCERDYYRRQNLVCDRCHEALRGRYIIAVGKKFHTDHFTCSVCSAIFGPNDSYYAHNDQVFCHFHYSTQFAIKCAGCQMAILKQYVESDRSGMTEQWHPECYMIHKYWNVKVADPKVRDTDVSIVQDFVPSNEAELIERQRVTEEKVYRIWTVLSAFEESSAVCISEMLLHVSNGAYVEGICLSERFLVHVEALFSGVDELERIYHNYDQADFKYTREAKMLCKKIINFFSLLSRTQEMRRLGITQELLSLVTGLAHYLKILIRISLTKALRLELILGRPIAVASLLNNLMEVAGKEGFSRDSQRLVKAAPSSDLCHTCKVTLEDECIRYGEYRWHTGCFVCRQCKKPLASSLSSATFSTAAQSIICKSCANINDTDEPTEFQHITKLTQFAYLLRVALSRLCSLLNITDAQLSSVDFSIKTHSTYIKDPPTPQPVSGNDHSYTGQADNGVERKVSRSFKSAKRATILGNADLSEKAYPSISESKKTIVRPLPVRKDSLVRRNGLPKSIQEIAKEEQEYAKGIRLDDVPQVARTVTESPALLRVGHTPINANTDRPRVYLSELSALQDMIIRHVAAVQIESYVHDFFSPNDLLQMIETKKVSIWEKIFASLFPSNKKPKVKDVGTFGVPLDILTERTGVESNLGASASPVRVAAFIDDSVTAMRQMDVSVEGIFRKNGNIRELKNLTEKLDKDPRAVDLFAESPIQIAALLKKFLRELPDPLLTYKMHGLFTSALKLESLAARKRVLQLGYCMLPRVNRDAVEVLFLFFRWVASFSHVTTDVGSRMDIPNLARVIAPNILTSTSKDSLKDESFTSIEVIELMLESFEDFCLVPEDLEPFLQDPDLTKEAIDLSSKSFLKKVEQVMKHSNLSSASTNIHQHHDYNELQQQHNIPPTSIYAQQGYLPYPNQHPSSDFRPITPHH